MVMAWFTVIVRAIVTVGNSVNCGLDSLKFMIRITFGLGLGLGILVGVCTDAYEFYQSVLEK